MHRRKVTGRVRFGDGRLEVLDPLKQAELTLAAPPAGGAGADVGRPLVNYPARRAQAVGLQALMKPVAGPGHQ